MGLPFFLNQSLVLSVGLNANCDMVYKSPNTITDMALCVWALHFFLKQIKNIPIFKNESECIENKLAHEKA